MATTFLPVSQVPAPSIATIAPGVPGGDIVGTAVAEAVSVWVPVAASASSCSVSGRGPSASNVDVRLGSMPGTVDDIDWVATAGLRLGLLAVLDIASPQ